MSSIYTNQNNVNKANQNTKNGFLFQSTDTTKESLTGNPSREDQNGGVSTYLEYNAQTRGDSEGSLGSYTKSCDGEKEKRFARKKKRKEIKHMPENWWVVG